LSYWIVGWGERLYPAWEWLKYDFSEAQYGIFTSDVIPVRARQVRWRGGRVLSKRGIIMRVPFEDILRLQSLSAYEKVDLLKENLRLMLQQARPTSAGMEYPTFYWQDQYELAGRHHNSVTIEMDYICPLCLKQETTGQLFPKCCNHYMVDQGDWDKDPLGWLSAREYEISQLAPEDRTPYEKQTVTLLEEEEQ